MKNIKNIIANFLVVLSIGIGLSGMAFAADVSSAKTNSANDVESFSGSYRVKANQTSSHRMYFYASEKVDVEIEGDGDTNLDLYVYDSNGTLCAKRTGSTDTESLTLDIYESDYFTIEIVNRGEVYNEYDIYVDVY